MKRRTFWESAVVVGADSLFGRASLIKGLSDMLLFDQLPLGVPDSNDGMAFRKISKTLSQGFVSNTSHNKFFMTQNGERICELRRHLDEETIEKPFYDHFLARSKSHRYKQYKPIGRFSFPMHKNTSYHVLKHKDTCILIEYNKKTKECSFLKKFPYKEKKNESYFRIRSYLEKSYKHVDVMKDYSGHELPMIIGSGNTKNLINVLQYQPNDSCDALHLGFSKFDSTSNSLTGQELLCYLFGDDDQLPPIDPNIPFHKEKHKATFKDVVQYYASQKFESKGQQTTINEKINQVISFYNNSPLPLPQGFIKKIKEQAMLESALNPNAISFRGALGLLQYMPQYIKKRWSEHGNSIQKDRGYCGDFDHKNIEHQIGLCASINSRRYERLLSSKQTLFPYQRMIDSFNIDSLDKLFQRYLFTTRNSGSGNVKKATQHFQKFCRSSTNERQIKKVLGLYNGKEQADAYLLGRVITSMARSEKVCGLRSDGDNYFPRIHALKEVSDSLI